MSKIIKLPNIIGNALQDGATLAISISGGKDSQAMLYALMETRTQANWPIVGNAPTNLYTDTHRIYLASIASLVRR